MKTNDHSSSPEEIAVEPLGRAVGSRYLTYALSTIMHRALPDVRDGLKPVHRRILYAMHELGLSAEGGFRKSAKINGDVMGNYHPHGDAAIYDAMVRLAQDFSVRYPLIDGQGNFGNIDGDNAAASRYTEARLTAPAEALLNGLGEDAVDFKENYDASLKEPVVLPAAFPNILANGASGIAVGMATNIPPHNIDELCAACLHLIETPNAQPATLMKLVPGPDFPTGGIIVEPVESIGETYANGRGAMRVRARYSIENLGHGQWQAVVTEIPYQVQKSRLIEKIAELIQLKKLPNLSDIRDESAQDIRIVLEPRSKNVDPDLLMESLFRVSDLETRISLNMNVLIDGRVPKVCGLKEILAEFLAHRREVLKRRTLHRLKKIDLRLEVLEGYLAAFLNLDRVIAIIRYEDHPKQVLIDEFTLNERQADAILNMRLRALRKLEEMALRDENDALLSERSDLVELLENEAGQWREISNQVKEIRKIFGAKASGGARRTSFGCVKDVPEISIEAMIEKEAITVLCSRMGWIRALKGHVDLTAPQKFKDGDEGRFRIHAYSTDKIIIFGSNGRFYTIPAHQLPGGRGMGDPVRLMIDLPNDVSIVALFLAGAHKKLLIGSDAGNGFIVSEQDVIAQTRGGKQVLNLKGEVKACVCRPVIGDMVSVISSNRKMLIFPRAELPELSRGKGVRLQKIKDGFLSDIMCFEGALGLQWVDPAGRQHTKKDFDEWVGARASVGRMAPRGFSKNNRFSP